MKVLPLYHLQTFSSTFSKMFAPVKPAIGTKSTFYKLYPVYSKNGLIFSTISSYLALDHLQSSILLITTTNFYTPKLFAS